MTTTDTTITIPTASTATGRDASDRPGRARRALAVVALPLLTALALLFSATSAHAIGGFRSNDQPPEYNDYLFCLGLGHDNVYVSFTDPDGDDDELAVYGVITRLLPNGALQPSFVPLAPVGGHGLWVANGQYVGNIIAMTFWAVEADGLVSTPMQADGACNVVSS